MKAFTTVCLLGVLVAAFAVVAVIAWNDASAGTQPAETPAVAASFEGERGAARPGAASADAPEQLLAVMRELLDGKEVECERMARLLLGLDEQAEIDDEQIFRLLLGLDGEVEIDRDHIAKVLGIEADETVDCEWTFRTLLGLEEGEEVDNEQLVRLLLGIDGHEDFDTKQVLRLLERAVAGGRTAG